MILATLRDRTAALHERVERAADIPARLASPAAYADLLVRFHGFYAPLEDRLAAVAGFDALDLGPRRKAHRLEDDLRVLGRAAGPRCERLPLIRTPADAFGCLYVLEGATLGGQIVRRDVARRFGYGPGTGCSFFSSYGDQLRPMWVAFGDALTRFADRQPDASEAVVAAAAETFTRFEEWLT